MRTLAEAAELRASIMDGSEGVPPERWRSEVAHFFTEDEDGLHLTYDPALAQTVAASSGQPAPDLWPLFDALAGLPLAMIRGANSDLLTPETFAEMRRRRPDAIAAEVPGRGHVPFLDEPESLAAIRDWIARL